MHLNRQMLLATAGAATALMFAGSMASSAMSSGLPRPPVPPISVGKTLRIVLLPPSPCRPSETGGPSCIAIGNLAQIYLLPPSPCVSGPICLP